MPEGVLVEDVVLIASELVSNAVRAGATQVGVTLHQGKGSLELVVDDDAGGWPTLTNSDHNGTRGRGLQIVDSLADTWTVTPRAIGKRVTARWSRRLISPDHAHDGRPVDGWPAAMPRDHGLSPGSAHWSPLRDSDRPPAEPPRSFVCGSSPTSRSPWCGRPRAGVLLARQHRQHHADVVAELGHVAAEELPGGVVGDLAVVLEDVRGVLDVGLG